MAGRIPIYRRVGDVLRTRPGKADSERPAVRPNSPGPRDDACDTFPVPEIPSPDPPGPRSESLQEASEGGRLTSVVHIHADDRWWFLAAHAPTKYGRRSTRELAPQPRGMNEETYLRLTKTPWGSAAVGRLLAGNPRQAGNS